MDVEDDSDGETAASFCEDEQPVINVSPSKVAINNTGNNKREFLNIGNLSRKGPQGEK